jgi:serine/threonine-protein kinase HipA
MKMNKQCLYCYEPLNESKTEFHEKCSLNFFGTKTPPSLGYSLNQMSVLAKSVIERSIAVTGVQPKLSLTVINETLGGTRLTVVAAMGGNYIFKPPSDYYPEMPENEHITMRIAEAFGIPTVPSSLIRLESGELSYITRRIDRKPSGEKIHMLDIFQVIEAYDKYKGSMEKTGKAIGTYSANTLLDKLSFFELSIFCFLTGNNDMHLKNFSLINTDDQWTFAPAYDLLNVAIVNPGDQEELALTLEGKKTKLKKEHFINLGKTLDLNQRQIDNAFNKFINNINLANEWIDKSFLSEEFKIKYKELLVKRFARLA